MIVNPRYRPANNAVIYRAHGLNWQLPLACPEWRPAPVNSPPDVVVRYGPVPSAPPSALAAGPLRQVTPELLRSRQMHLIEHGPRDASVGPYDYSPAVLEKLRRLDS